MGEMDGSTYLATTINCCLTLPQTTQNCGIKVYKNTRICNFGEEMSNILDLHRYFCYDNPVRDYLDSSCTLCGTVSVAAKRNIQMALERS